MQKSLDRKLESIHADPSGSPEFITADTKDADMAFGIGAPGLSPERHDAFPFDGNSPGRDFEDCGTARSPGDGRTRRV